MGPLYYKKRTQDSLSFPSGTDRPSSGNPVTQESREKGSLDKRGPISTGKRGIGRSSKTTNTGKVFTYVHRNKENRGTEACYGLKAAESEGGMPPFQNGNSTIYKGPIEGGGVGSLGRLVGRLPPPSGSPELSQISQNSVSGQDPTIQGNVFRVVHSPLDIHESHKGGSSILQESVDPDTYVSGRLAHQSRQPPDTYQRCPESTRQSDRAWLDCQPEKVRVGAHTTFHFSGDDHQFESGHSQTNIRGKTKDQNLVPLSQRVRQSHCKGPNELSGSPESCSGHDYLRQTIPSPFTMVSQMLLGKGQGFRDGNRAKGNLLSTPAMVGKGGLARKGSPFTCSQSSDESIYRCQQPRLGGISRRKDCQGSLGSQSGQSAHKLPRNASNYSSSRVLSERTKGQMCVGEVRQHHSGFSYKETRWHSIPQTMCFDQAVAANVSGQGSNSSSVIHSREKQCISRPTLQVRSGGTVGMDVVKAHLPQDPPIISRNNGGSICHKVDKTVRAVCVPGTGQSSLGGWMLFRCHGIVSRHMHSLRQT